MSDQEFLFFTGFFTLIIIFFVGLFIQEISREEIFFGIRVPTTFKQSLEFKWFNKRYKISFSISYAVVSIVYMLFLKYFNNIILFTCGILCFPLIIFLNYYFIHKKVKKLKEKENWQINTKNFIVVDTEFRQNKDKRLQPSALWFLFSVALIVFNIILSILKYPVLPEIITTHWDINSITNGWMEKSYFTVLMLPFIEAIMLLGMFFIYKIIGRAKQQLNPSDIDGSKQKSRRFRYIWSVYYIIACFIVVVIFTLIQLVALNIFQDMKTITIFLIAISIFLSIGAIIIALITGQSGSRFKLKDNVQNKQSGLTRDDDKFWKLGMFYYNKEDPSIFIEKRMGVGWDLNYAKTVSKIIVGFIILLIISCIAIPIFFI